MLAVVDCGAGMVLWWTVDVAGQTMEQQKKRKEKLRCWVLVRGKERGRKMEESRLPFACSEHLGEVLSATA